MRLKQSDKTAISVARQNAPNPLFCRKKKKSKKKMRLKPRCSIASFSRKTDTKTVKNSYELSTFTIRKAGYYSNYTYTTP